MKAPGDWSNAPKEDWKAERSTENEVANAVAEDNKASLSLNSAGRIMGMASYSMVNSPVCLSAALWATEMFAINGLAGAALPFLSPICIIECHPAQAKPAAELRKPG